MFSILMSCYSKDSANDLKEAIESIYNQSLKPNEFVIICDGPLNTNLDEVIGWAVLASKDNGIKLIVHRLQKNVGLGEALNVGVKLCTQKYIVRMDSDDISTLDRLEEMRKAICEFPNVDVFGAQIEEFQYNIGDLNRKRIVPLNHESILKGSSIKNPMNHVTVCIKKDSLVQSGSYESMHWHEDYFLWLKMLSKGYRFFNLDKVTVLVRVKDLSTRRTGWIYIKAEMNFAFEALIRQYWSLFSAVKFLVPRIIVRLLPNKIVDLVYRYIRK